ncbi:hypothetical protein ES332_D13G041100v1 [Gossypium tomentosum]|uniref:Uncharacterized protein n=1 Tax=Gossypium tomentosum TaxID=34277 RepID=A0A5D2HUJ0_GOSTO|nr:hypothetical protein ES332_D13G041100v1 [Gossypium tomentosum]
MLMILYEVCESIGRLFALFCTIIFVGQAGRWSNCYYNDQLPSPSEPLQNITAKFTSKILPQTSLLKNCGLKNCGFRLVLSSS